MTRVSAAIAAATRPVDASTTTAPTVEPPKVADAPVAAVQVFVPLIVRGPNAHETRGARIGRVRKERKVVAAALAGKKLPRLPVVVTMNRCGSGSRGLDSDNLAGAMKSIRDEVAKILGVDDASKWVAWRCTQSIRSGARGVRISICAADALPPSPPVAPKKTRRVLTDAERAERDQALAERAARRDADRAALDSLAPSARVAGEPPVQGEWIIPIDPRTGAGTELLRALRPNGSELVVSAKTYDGMQGGVPRSYAFASVWFRGANGLRYRSKGVQINADELRPMSEALIKLANDLDAAEAPTT